MKAFVFNLIILALFLAPAYGQSVTAPSPEAPSAANSPAVASTSPAESTSNNEVPASEPHFPVFQTVGGLGLVLCLIVAAYFAVKKLAPQYFAKHVSGKNLRLIETLAMGEKRSISLIQVANNRFLVGNTPNQITLLASLSEPISLASESDAAQAEPGNANGKEPKRAFRNMFEVERSRPSRYAANPISEDVRAKMRQLREALER